jgi:hypothetical protein
MPARDAPLEDPLHRLLVALCRRDAPASVDAATFALLADPAQRDGFLALAAHHRLSGLALAALCRNGRLNELSESAGHACRRQLKALRRRAAGIELERDHVVASLEGAAVRAVVLKGAALVGSVYRDPVERDLQDLDFLVEERDLRAAVRVFVGEGYDLPRQPGAMLYFRRHHFHVPVDKGGLLGADIHWALDRPSAPSRLEARMFLAEAYELVRPGRPRLRVPRPEHMILHLVLQCGSEGFGRLSRFVDLDRIVTATADLRWGALVAAARTAGLGASTALALRLAQRAFDTDVPEPVLRELFPDSVARAHVALLRPRRLIFEEDVERTHPRRHLLALWLADDRRRRLRFALGLLAAEQGFPPRKERLGLAGRLLRWPKLALSQLLAYARAAMELTTPRGRAQMRFWSRNASRSERR